jgi:hypothetical protein
MKCEENFNISSLIRFISLSHSIFEHNTCKITSLDEFWNYTIEVTASTDKGSSIPETCFNQTKEDGHLLFEKLNSCTSSVSKINSLITKGQIYNFINHVVKAL